MARGRIRRAIVLAAVGGSCLWTVEAPADQTPPPRLTFSVSTGIDADSNRSLSLTQKDPATTLDTRLGLAYAARTRLSSFDLSFDGLLRYGDLGRSDTGPGLQQPQIRLAYSRETGNARFTASAQYRRTEVNLSEPLLLSDGSPSPTDLVAVTGTATSFGAKLGFETGLKDPWGFSVSASADRRSYSQTTDPSVYGNRSTGLTSVLRYDVDPSNRVTLTLDARTQRYDDTLQTHRRQAEARLGYIRELSPNLRFEIDAGYTRTRTDTTPATGGAVQVVSRGPVASASLERTLPGGTASLRFATARDSAGQRNTFEVGGSVKRPRATFEATAGVSLRPGQGPQAVGSFSYGLKGSVDSFRATLSRTVTLSAENADIAYTTANLAYSRELSPLSSLDLSLSFTQTGDGGLGTVIPVDRQNLRAAWSYELTQDWSLDAGYMFRRLDQKGSGRATSNEVFVTLGRKVVLWP